MNVVMTGSGKFVEVQGTAEGAPFDRAELDALLDAGRQGLRRPDPPAEARPSARDARVGWSWRRNNAKKLAELRRILEPLVPGHRGARAGRRHAVRRAGRDRADLRGQRPAQGAGLPRPRPACRRWPTTRACASTPSTACRACCRRAGRVSAKDEGGDAANNAPAAEPARRRARRAPRRDVPLRHGALHAGRSRDRRDTARCAVASCAPSTGAAASATTRCSPPTATTSRPPSSRRPRRTASATAARARGDRAARRGRAGLDYSRAAMTPVRQRAAAGPVGVHAVETRSRRSSVPMVLTYCTCVRLGGGIDDRGQPRAVSTGRAVPHGGPSTTIRVERGRYVLEHVEVVVDGVRRSPHSGPRHAAPRCRTPSRCGRPPR